MNVKSIKTMTYLIALILLFSNCSKKSNSSNQLIKTDNSKTTMSSNTDTAVFGAGCFWCVETIFDRLKGVQSVESGYAGGTVENPTYEQVCNGNTGHAEVARITFDPSVISFEELLEVFWTTHDPTTLNRQGADVGTQYRSAVFYLNEEQKQTAEKSKKEYAPQLWDNEIVTEISPLNKFYPAENYHQDYYNQNSEKSYCKFVINPKLQKFREKFKDKIKEGQ